MIPGLQRYAMCFEARLKKRCIKHQEIWKALLQNPTEMLTDLLQYGWCQRCRWQGKRSCQFWVLLNNCNNKNLSCERKINPGDFSSQFCWMLLLLLPISSSVVNLSAYSKGANTCAHKRNMSGQNTDRSSQAGEQGLHWESHQTNSTHMNVKNTNGPMLFLGSDWSGLKFAGWYIYTHLL